MSRQSLVQRWSSLLLLALLVGVVLHYAIPQVAYRIARHVEAGRRDGEYQSQLAEAQQQQESQIRALQRLAQEVGRSIVRVHAPGEDADEIGPARGFGVIVDTRALAVTSLSLIEGLRDVPLSLGGHPEPLRAQVKAIDELADLALLEFDPPPGDLISIRLLAKEPPQLGQDVLALSDAGDLRDALSLGMILRRGTQNRRVCVHDVDFIGTDVATDSNIGSPLMNFRGEILGICIAEHATNDPVRGHVLPAPVADTVIGDMLQYGRVRHGWIGAFLHADVLPGAGRAETRVAHVDYVVPGSPADRSGLRAGDDILLMTQHVPVVGVGDLQRMILATLPPETLRLSILRHSAYQVITVPVELQPLLPPLLPGEKEWGLRLACPQSPSPVDPDEILTGVLVQEVSRREPGEGIRPGDVIVGLNGAPTPNLESYCREAAAVVSSRIPVRLDVWRRGEGKAKTIELAGGSR